MKEPLAIGVGEGKGYNVITIQGQISAESANSVADIILRSKKGPYVVHVTSSGGSVMAGRSIVEVLNSFDAPVTWISRSYCASMACIMPHLGDGLRLCYKATAFMYHAAKFAPKGSADEILEGMATSIGEHEEIIKIVQKAIGLTKREYQRYNGPDRRVTAEQAMAIGKHGMIDGIILKDYRNGEFDIMTRQGKKHINVLEHRRADLVNLPVID